MSGQSSIETKAQLDKSEREHLEDVVTELREIVEADIEYQLKHTYELDDEDAGSELSGEEAKTRAELVTAVDREDGDKSWEEKFERYVMGVGYTIVNRITALRCMEVRGFINRPITQFGDSGTTPSAEEIEREEYLGTNEAIIEAYDRACVRLSEEIELLFDIDSPYSIVSPDVEIFKELCQTLDQVSEGVWKADDVLGWIYEYYNVNRLDELRRKGREEGLSPEDVPPANQFYTPHWVVRMLTDNSLGKLYLEHTGEFTSAVDHQQNLSETKRKDRPVAPNESPTIQDFCTYLVPSEDEGKSPEFSEPSEIRVIDPACGSGHFLLYAFDVLERIWRTERPNLDRSEIPRKILENNLFGVDLDLRACQLAAFNLYLKARTRAESEGAEEFGLPEIGIVCSDAHISNINTVEEVFEEVANDNEEVIQVLEELLHEFENISGIGSLLDVRGTLSEQFLSEHSEVQQTTVFDDWDRDFTLSGFIDTLQSAIEDHRDSDSFVAKDLESFLRLLSILSQDYDVSLMNPPYGAQKRMPNSVQKYVEDHYEYPPEYYINFVEVCERLTKENGRIGMLVPRSFMFKRSFEKFRSDFIGGRGAFDFLAEFGLGILDNATVRTVGTVVRAGEGQDQTGTFIRLYDIDAGKKELAFTQAYSDEGNREGIERIFNIPLSEFEEIPRKPLNYAIPPGIRQLHRSDLKLSFDEGSSKPVCEIAQGLSTGDNPRFIRAHWESPELDYNYPYAKGGSDAWIIPSVDKVVQYRNNGREMRPLPGSVLRNTQHYGKEGLTWTYIKSTGRRFGYLPSDCIFDHTGSMIFPKDELSPWTLMSVINSDLYHGLFLSLTPDRHWTPGVVSRIPWFEQFSEIPELEKSSKKQYRLKLEEQLRNPTSPFYMAPSLMPEECVDEFYYDYHQFTDFAANQWGLSFESGSRSETLSELTRKTINESNIREYNLERIAQDVEEEIHDVLDIGDKSRAELDTEIKLRTSENPEDRLTEELAPVDVSSEDLEFHVKRLIHHISLECVSESKDGVVPVEAVGSNDTILDNVILKFENIYGKFAEDRLAEADSILGNQTPEEEAYPNIRNWLENSLFEFHIETMGNIPIIWKLTTSRLVSDPHCEGFACFVDYHQIDANLFDRIESNYLEPLKSEYRSQRNASDQRRSNPSLSTTEQSEANEEFNRYESALEQINEFQEAALELSANHPRKWEEEQQSLAMNLAPKVETFRSRISERLETLDELVEVMDSEDIENQFSPTFLERVNDNREEWIAALNELEEVLIELSQEQTETIEAHLYDVLTYFEELVGSTHYSSNGIFFMNYYFNKGQKYLDDGRPRENLDSEARLFAELASETDKDIQIGEEILEGCSELQKSMPSNWRERAISEVLTAGYNPVKRHGVAINIQPLANKKIVPEAVEDKVV